MKLNKVLADISAPTRVAVIMTIFQSKAIATEDTVMADLLIACKQLGNVEHRIENCRSSADFWALQPDKCYWKAIRDILKAAAIVGPDNLPDIDVPKIAIMEPMEAISEIESFGYKVLRAAEAKGGVYENY